MREEGERVEMLKRAVREGFAEKRTVELPREGSVKVSPVTVQGGEFQAEGAVKVKVFPENLSASSLPLDWVMSPFIRLLSQYISLSCFKPPTALGIKHTFLTTLTRSYLTPSPLQTPLPHFIGSSHSSLLPGLRTRRLVPSSLLSLPRNSPQSLSCGCFLLLIKVLATQKRLPRLPKSSAHSLSHGHFPLTAFIRGSTIRKTYHLFTKEVVISYCTESGPLCIIRSLENKEVINVR